MSYCVANQCMEGTSNDPWVLSKLAWPAVTLAQSRAHWRANSRHDREYWGKSDTGFSWAVHDTDWGTDILSKVQHWWPDVTSPTKAPKSAQTGGARARHVGQMDVCPYRYATLGRFVARPWSRHQYYFKKIILVAWFLFICGQRNIYCYSCGTL